MTGPNGPQNPPPGGYQPGPQGGYQQGGYQQGPPPGGHQQGYPQQGPPWGPRPPKGNSGLIIGIVSAIAVALAVALVLVLVLDKDEPENTANNGGGPSAPVSVPEGAPTVEVPPPNQTGGAPTGGLPSGQVPTQADPTGQTGGGEPVDPSAGGDEAAVRAQVDKFFAAANAGDWDAVAALTCSSGTAEKVAALKGNFEQAGGRIDYQVGSITFDDAEHGVVELNLAVLGQTETITVDMVKEGDWKYCGE